MKPTLIFIHGAFSSSNVFNYFKIAFADYPQLVYTYDWNESPSVVGKELAEFARSNATTSNVVLIGHSLGGNVAIQSLLYFDELSTPVVKRVLTYGSPLGGSQHAVLMRLFSSAAVFGHIQPKSREVRVLKKIADQHADLITSFVTTRGPLSNTNDGVVTVASQTALQGANYIHVATNHMEVLLSDDVIATTRAIIEI